MTCHDYINSAVFSSLRRSLQHQPFHRLLSERAYSDLNSLPLATTSNQSTSTTTKPHTNMPLVAISKPTGIVCTCAESTYDEVGCMQCFEKGLCAIEHPEIDSNLSSETSSVADLSLDTPISESKVAVEDYAKGVFCTCEKSAYDELGCDSCIERAFQAMKH